MKKPLVTYDPTEQWRLPGDPPLVSAEEEDRASSSLRLNEELARIGAAVAENCPGQPVRWRYTSERVIGMPDHAAWEAAGRPEPGEDATPIVTVVAKPWEQWEPGLMVRSYPYPGCAAAWARADGAWGVQATDGITKEAHPAGSAPGLVGAQACADGALAARGWGKPDAPPPTRENILPPFPSSPALQALWIEDYGDLSVASPLCALALRASKRYLADSLGAVYLVLGDGQEDCDLLRPFVYWPGLP